MDIKKEIWKDMKELQCVPELVVLDLLEEIKMTKFDTFRGIRNPLAHLRAYSDQLVGRGRDEDLLTCLFS